MADYRLYPPLDAPRGGHESLLDDPATDPALAGVIRDLRSRWPRIGQRADHPLTDHFIRRRRGRVPVMRFVVALSFVLALFGGVCAALFFGWDHFALTFFIFGIVNGAGPAFNLLNRNFPRPGTLNQMYHQMLGNKDPHIQLLPIHTRELLAVHVAVALYRYRTSDRRQRRFILGAVAMSVAWLGSAVIYRHGADYGVLFCLAGVFTAVAAIYSSLTSELQAILSAIGNFGGELVQERQASQKVSFLTCLAFIGAILYAVGASINYLGEADPPLLASLHFIVPGVLFFLFAWLVRRDLRVYPDMVFEQYVARLEKIPEAPPPGSGPLPRTALGRVLKLNPS